MQASSRNSTRKPTRKRLSPRVCAPARATEPARSPTADATFPKNFPSALYRSAETAMIFQHVAAKFNDPRNRFVLAATSVSSRRPEQRSFQFGRGIGGQAGYDRFIFAGYKLSHFNTVGEARESVRVQSTTGRIFPGIGTKAQA